MGIVLERGTRGRKLEQVRTGFLHVSGRFVSSSLSLEHTPSPPPKPLLPSQPGSSQRKEQPKKQLTSWPMTRNPTPYGRFPYCCVLFCAPFKSQLDLYPIREAACGSVACDSRSEIPCTILATGIGRPYSIFEPIACWRMKLLSYQ